MSVIQVLGIAGHKETDLLKSNVGKALQQLSSKIEVQEITELDELIKRGISGIPALIVNGEAVLQQVVPSVEDLKVLLSILLKPASKTFSIKKLLVPVDFSDAAAGAFSFAQAFAGANNGKIHLLHAFHPDIMPSFPVIPEISEDFQKMREEELELFSKENTYIDSDILINVNIKNEVVPGFPTEQIVRLSKTKEVDMIVMGTTGQSGILERMFGSVSSTVAKRAHCPVMLIPKDVKYQPFKNILYATNYEPGEEIILQQLADFAGKFSANIHLAHVWENSPEGFHVDEFEIKKAFNHIAPGASLKIIGIENKTVLHGINHYVSENDIDLVVMATSHRGFINKLMHKSMTTSMAFNARIPLMVFHLSDVKKAKKE